MKKKIAILGSTGSIGKTTFNIIKKNKKEFEVVLLTTNKNINEIFKQAQILKAKNFHMVPIRKSAGYTDTGKKKYNRFFQISKIKQVKPLNSSKLTQNEVIKYYNSG